jgi:hypothetical protein
MKVLQLVLFLIPILVLIGSDTNFQFDEKNEINPAFTVKIYKEKINQLSE